MNIKEIKNTVKSPKYDFLREREGLGDNIILLTLGGSYAYGTNTLISDLDVRGICLNTKEELLTMQCRDKPYKNKETDTVVYPLYQLSRLLYDANPNVLEILGTKEDQLFTCNKQGRLLRENSNLFLSKKVIYSFGGYAATQLRKLQNALARDSYPQGEKEKHIFDTLTRQMIYFREKYAKFDENSIKLSIDKSEKEDYEEEIFVDVDLKHYPLRDFTSIYSEINNILSQYGSLNSRNRKKDELHLNKHAMHLIRILVMGTEILEGKGINTYREKDRDFFMKIRNGELVLKKNGEDDYSQVFEIVDEYERKFGYAAENTALPDSPDQEKIKELIMTLNMSVLKQ